MRCAAGVLYRGLSDEGDPTRSDRAFVEDISGRLDAGLSPLMSLRVLGSAHQLEGLGEVWITQDLVV